MDGERLRWRFIISPLAFVPLRHIPPAIALPRAHYIIITNLQRSHLDRAHDLGERRPCCWATNTQDQTTRLLPPINNNSVFICCPRGKFLARGAPEQWIKSWITTGSINMRESICHQGRVVRNLRIFCTALSNDMEIVWMRVRCMVCQGQILKSLLNVGQI
jgi:hypothetical protein